MTRYVALARPKQHVSDDYYQEHRETMTVHAVDGTPSDTGLVDHLGVPIMRLSERGPLGFCR